MRSQELKISPQSDYYVYVPSALAKKLYLYPVSVGYFIYEPDYFISRNNFDSFLIMHIAKGTCHINTEGKNYKANAGQFVLLDCYIPHKYGSPDAWEAIWIHFDGPLAREYFKEITGNYGHVISPNNPTALSHSMGKIYDSFHNALPINESKLSGYLTNVLDGFLSAPENKKSFLHTVTIADSVAYINEHFHEPISLDELAAKAGLSQFHFTRIFTKRRGSPPSVFNRLRESPLNVLCWKSLRHR